VNLDFILDSELQRIGSGERQAKVMVNRAFKENGFRMALPKGSLKKLKLKNAAALVQLIIYFIICIATIKARHCTLC
jgi:hypothetical protein